MSKATTTTRPSPRRVAVGTLLDRLGQLALPLGLGLFFGYWMSDRGVAWMPTMLAGLAVFFAYSLLLILAGQWLKGKVVRKGEARGGLRVRKRVVTLLVLAALAAGVRLGVHVLEQPAPLTRLGADELRTSFELDTAQYRRLERELEGLVSRVERSPLVRLAGERQALTDGDEKLLREVWTAFLDSAFALEQIRIFYEDYYRFDPSRAGRTKFLRSYLLTYAAELALFEKSFRLTRLFVESPEIKKFLDAPHPEQGLPEHTFSRFRQEFLGARDEARVVAGEQYLRFLARTVRARRTAAEGGFEPLWDDVERHLRTVDGAGFLERAEHTVRADFQVVKRTVRRTWYPAQKSIANWMGDVKLRRVGRYLITSEQVAEADRHLESGDILLSRKNWYLSNVGLPGFWPHAILYLGDPEKLERTFDVPEVRAYLKELTGEPLSLDEYLLREHPAAWAQYLAGLDGEPITVLEAVGEGVILNSLAAAAGDYLAALRPRLGRLAKAQAILEAFSHLGKPYDFDFDFATDHALVCTEVVWRSYRGAEGKAGLRLPIEKIAGRLTLPANRIVGLYDEEHSRVDRQLDFVYFLDARESEERAVVASEEELRQSHRRLKWDLAQR